MMRGMVHRPGRERAQRMTFITALPLYTHTLTQLPPGLIDRRTFLFRATTTAAVFTPTAAQKKGNSEGTF